MSGKMLPTLRKPRRYLDLAPYSWSRSKVVKSLSDVRHLLAHLTPIDLLAGTKIDTARSLAWTNAKEYHHFFPRDYLKNKGVSGAKANCLANIILLTSSSNKTISNRAPSDYLKDVQKAAGGDIGEWLESNLISEEAYNAALEDEFETFIEVRSKDINARVCEMAGWDEN